MEAVDEPVDSRVLRAVFSSYPSGVTALCAQLPAGPTGLAASSFTSVSLDPPMVSVCIARTSTTWPRLRQAPRLGLSVLSARQEAAARALAGPAAERFRDLDTTRYDDSAIVIHGAASALVCSLEREIEAGDHEIVLLRIHSYEAATGVEPLVFHGSQYRQLH